MYNISNLSERSIDIGKDLTIKPFDTIKNIKINIDKRLLQLSSMGIISIQEIKEETNENVRTQHPRDTFSNKRREKVMNDIYAGKVNAGMSLEIKEENDNSLLNKKTKKRKK